MVMDNLIRFLGENYHLFEQFGAFIIGLVLILCATIIWRIIRSRMPGMKKAIGLVLSVIVAALIVLPVLFIQSKIDEIHIPTEYKKTVVSIPTTRAVLSGEILLPLEGEKLPALIFLVGSDVSSYRTNYSRLINEVIVPVFSEKNYAMLFFDKPGIGKSTGDWMLAGIEDRATDVKSIVQYLKTIEVIDSSKIGVIGHSQGGWVAQLAAAKIQELSFMISLAGPVTSVREQTGDDEFNAQRCDGVDSLTAKKQVDSLLNSIDRESQTASDGIYKQWAVIKGYDPASVIKSIRQPALFVFGENDRLVPLKKNEKRLREIFENAVPENISISIIPGAAHSLRKADFCFRGSQQSLPYVHEFIVELKRWLQGIE
jgi:uncharacterized protein